MTENAEAELKRQRKEDAEYLNSIKRPVMRISVSVIEYILMFIIITIMMNYVRTGTFDIGGVPSTIEELLKPGSVLVVAIVGFLPIILFKNIGMYFGLGTYPRMVFEIVKIIAIAVWFFLIVNSVGNLDLVEFSGLSSSSLNGLESFIINLRPLFVPICLIMTACLIIPVAEFYGARKKHLQALERHRQLAGE